MGRIQKWKKLELRFLCTALRVIARSMHTKFGVIWTYDDKIRSGQGKRDDADAETDNADDADDAADQSNTYMSPCQATQKCYLNLILNLSCVFKVN